MAYPVYHILIGLNTIRLAKDMYILIISVHSLYECSYNKV